MTGPSNGRPVHAHGSRYTMSERISEEISRQRHEPRLVIADKGHPLAPSEAHMCLQNLNQVSICQTAPANVASVSLRDDPRKVTFRICHFCEDVVKAVLRPLPCLSAR